MVYTHEHDKMWDGGSYCFTGNARSDGQVLENRLDKTMIKYNEARWYTWLVASINGSRTLTFKKKYIPTIYNTFPYLSILEWWMIDQ